MGRKTLISLAALLVLLVLGYWLTVREPASVPADTGRAQALLADLQVAQVQAIEVLRAEQPLIRVERQDGGWQVPGKDGYPADALSVAQTLAALAAARQVEARTANPALHARLGLADAGSPSEQGVLVRLELRDNPVPIELRIGNLGSRSGQLLRHAADNQVWLVDREIPLPSSELAWLDRRITQIPFAQIRQLQLTYADGERLTLYRENSEQPNMLVRQLPSGSAMAYEAAANSAANVFGNLDYLEAVPLEQLQWSTPALLKIELESFEDGRLLAEIHQHGEQYWLLLTERQGISTERVPAVSGWAFQVDPKHYHALVATPRTLLNKN